MGEEAMSLGLGSEVALRRGAGPRGRYFARPPPPRSDGARGSVPSVPGGAGVPVFGGPPPARKGLGWTPPDLAIWWPSGSVPYRGYSSAGYRTTPTCAGFRKRAMADGSPYYTGSQRRSINATLRAPNPVTAFVFVIIVGPFPICTKAASRNEERSKNKIQTFV